MNCATLAQARQWVASGSGACSKDDLTNTVNVIRRHFFNLYEQMALFLDVTECYRVQRFCTDCNVCSDSFLGVTLGREAANVEAMWHNDYPVQLQSSWREFQAGITPECDCRLQKFDLPGVFSTFADIYPLRPKKLKALCHNPADVGKPFIVRGELVSGARGEWLCKLTTEPQVSPDAFRSIDHRGGVIKEVTEGRVILADEDGRVLGQYEKEETVPSYRRNKITGLPSDCSVVNIRSARKFFPVYGDNDVVETDNAIAWDDMAHYVRLHKKADKTQMDILAAKDHLASAKAHLLGDQTRNIGKANEAHIAIATPSIRVGRLMGRGRRW